MKEFEEIYRTYFSDVYKYLRRLSGDEQLAEEITSQTFFKAMNALDSFRGDCDVRVWLCQIAKNLYYAHLRKEKRNVPLEENEELVSELNVEELYLRNDEAARIRRILHTMEDPGKEVFLWRVYGELSFKEIGRLFHKSENWA